MQRRNVHVFHFFRRAERIVFPLSAGDHLVYKSTLLGEWSVGLSDVVTLFDVRCQIDEVIANFSVVYLTIRGFQKAVRVHTTVRTHGNNKTNVRTFRGLNRTHSTIVAVVNVPNLEAGSFPGKTARPQRVQSSLVGQFGQRVGLIHELGKLAGAEEFVNHGHDRLDGDQSLRSDYIHILDGHSFLYDSLHSAEAYFELVHQELAHASYAAVTQMIDVVIVVSRNLVNEIHKVLQRFDDIYFAEGAIATVFEFLLVVETELVVDLVAAYVTQIVGFIREE